MPGNHIPQYTAKVIFLILLAVATGYTAVLFETGFETGRTVVLSAVKPGARTIRLAPGAPVSQWPKEGGIGLIEGNFPAHSEEFSYTRRRGEVLLGVQGISAFHPRFCPVQTSTLEEWGSVGFSRKTRDFISLRRADSPRSGYNARISMAAPSQTFLQRYTVPAEGRHVRFSFICDPQLLAPESNVYFRLFEFSHDDYDLPALVIIKGAGKQSARIEPVTGRTRRLDTPRGPTSFSTVIVKPDSLYTVDYRYQFIAVDTAWISLRVNGVLMDSTRMVCFSALKTPRYQYRIGKLSDSPLPGALYLDDIIETKVPPPVLPPVIPTLSQSEGTLFIQNAPNGSYEAQWQISRNNTWIMPHFFTAPRADFFPSLCIPRTAQFHLFNNFLAVPVYGNSRCNPFVRDQPPAFAYTVAHPGDSSLFARVRIRTPDTEQWSGWSVPQTFEPGATDTLPVDPISLPPLPAIRLNIGWGLPFVRTLPHVRRGHSFTLKLSTPQGAAGDTIYSTDIWLSSVESDAAGGYANRGGPFDSTTQYVLSVSYRSNSLWARVHHGSLLFTVLGDTSDAYLNPARSTMDTRRKRAELSITLPDYVQTGLWTVSAFSRNSAAACSPVRTELFVVTDKPASGVLFLGVAIVLIAALTTGTLLFVRKKRIAVPQINQPVPFAGLSISARAPDIPEPMLHKEKVESALNYIRDNYMKDIAPCDIARECTISADWLGKLFKKSMGMSVISYLTQVRLDQASRLLIESELNVTEVCYRVGYNNPNYFSKAFTKHTGLSPRDFRKKNRKG